MDKEPRAGARMTHMQWRIEGVQSRGLEDGVSDSVTDTTEQQLTATAQPLALAMGVFRAVSMIVVDMWWQPRMPRPGQQRGKHRPFRDSGL